MKKHILATVIGSTLLSASATASTSMVMRIPLKENLSSYSATDPVYHPWMDVGTHYACESWSPETNTVNYGQSFTQTRDCSQNQTRNVDIREYDSFSDSIRIVRTDKEDRTISEEESQGAVGTYRDWGVTESTFTEWSDVGVDYDFSSWSPVAANQTENFSQSRDYSRDQERFEQKRELDAVTGDIRNTGDPLKHEKTDPRSQSRDVAVAATAWSDVGGHYSCEAWSPTPEEVDVYEEFTQTRDCKQNQSRRWSYDSQGSEIHARMQNRTISETESQDSVGTRRDWIAYDSTFTDWEDTGSAHSYTQWSPAPVEQTANFTQTRSYKQPQERDEQKRQIDTVSGEIRDNGDLITHTQDDSRSDSRSVIVNWTNWEDTQRTGHTAWLPAKYDETVDFQQTREFGQHQIRDRFYTTGASELKRVEENRIVSPVYEHRTVSVAANAWSNTTRSGHTAWGPATYTETENFTQSRKYTQNQERTWSYKAGTEVLDTRLETRGVANQTENRSVVVSVNSWSNTDRDSHSSWSPAPTTQITDFTQSRTYTQNQERTWTYKTGSSTLDTRLETRGVASQSENRTVSVSWNNWSVTKEDYNCGTWSPATNTKGYDESFTQTRSCKQDEKRTRTYKSGSTTLTSAIENRTINVTQSRSATGTGSWSAYTPSCGSWSSTGNHSYGSYSPAHGSQTSNYTQTRSYKQDQSRTCQPRERDSISGTIRNTGSTYTDTQTVNKSQSRTITVSGSGWSNTTKSGYSSYSPAAGTQTSNFTQTRTYTQNQKYTYTHKSGTTTVYARDITRGVSGQSESRTVTATWGAYAFYRNHSFSGYSPATSTVCSGSSFTQTETYKRQEKRTISYNIGGTGPSSYRDINKSRTRSATGTKSCWASASSTYSSWSNDGGVYSCSSYSPSASTVNMGQSYTQTRSCTQKQKRTKYNREYNSSTGQYRTVSTSTEYRTISVTQNRSATGTKDYVVNSDYREYGSSYSSWSCGAYTPYTYNVTCGMEYTQSRNCTRTKTNYYKQYKLYKSGSKTYVRKVTTGSTTQSKTDTRTAFGTKSSGYNGCQMR